MKYLIFIIILISIHSIHAQKHLILIGRQAQKDYHRSTSLEYDCKIDNNHRIYFLLNNTDNYKQFPIFNYTSTIEYSRDGGLNSEYFFTTPSATSINLGLKQKLNKHKNLDLYIAPELSIIHTGKYKSYKKEKILVSVDEQSSINIGFLDFLFLFFGSTNSSTSTIYTKDVFIKVANVPDTYNYYLNCKTGMSINYKNVILDFNIGLGRKLDSNLIFKPNDTYYLVRGYQPSKVTLFSSMNVGYQF